MHYVFSVWMFINCILALDFAVRSVWLSEMKYIENRMVAVLCFGSALWSGSFAALFVQTDAEIAYICRCFGMLGTFLYLITAQMLVSRVSGMHVVWRRIFDGISYTGVIVFFLTIKKGEVIYTLTDDGMTYYFKAGFCNDVYIAYVVIVCVEILVVIEHMLRRRELKRIQAFGKKFLLVAGLLILGMLFDTVFPMFGFGAIPGSSIMQFFGMVVVYNAVYQINRSRINIANMSQFIYSSLTVPVLVYDVKRKLQILNDASSAFFQVGQNDQSEEETAISRLFELDEEKVFAFEEELRDVDAVCRSNQVYCSLAVSKIHDPYGDIIGYIIIVTDLSERVSTMQKLEEAVREADAANQAKSTFLANMSHEIRTPMNAIIGFSELCLKMDLGRQVREYVEDIRDSSENLLAIINDLLDISKIESGRMELVCNDYYIGTIFQDVHVIINSQAKKKGLDFSMSLAPDIPCKLYGDKIRLRGVLINLLNNAVKYTKEGSVSFGAKVLRQEDGIVTLEFKVADTGIGIREREQERIFESFSQVDYKINYGVEGTGLGLAIVKGYVGLMNGDITVESKYGEGSVFTVVIEQTVIDASPIERVEEQATNSANDFSLGEIKMPGVKVLVVDDNLINLKVASSTLMYYELQVDTASSGMEAIELCRRNRYALVFMDQMMPQMSGIEAMREIRKLDSHYGAGGACKIIVLTANAVTGVRRQMIEEGFDEYLGKPMNYKQLERLLRRYIPQEDITSQREAAIGDDVENSDKLREMLPQVDIDEGILFCGGLLERYIEVLRLACSGGEEQLGKLELLWKEQAYGEYTIQVHGMKGSMRSIGAKKLSEKAKALERAGRENDYAYINANTEEFCAEYRGLLAQLAQALEPYGAWEADESGQGGHSFTEEDAKQTIQEILRCLDEYDFASATKRIRETLHKELPETYRADFEQIGQWMDDLEDDKIREFAERKYGHL